MQSTTSEATGCLLLSAAAVAAGIAAMAFLAFGGDAVLECFDVGVPWRQLLQNRTLDGLALSCRIFYAIVASLVAAKLMDTPAFRSIRG